MRKLTLLLITAVIGLSLVSCQDSTTLPDNGPAATTVPVDRMIYTLESDPVLYGVTSGGDALSIVDLATGVSTLVGPLDPDPKIYATPIAMAIRACDGAIYVWNNSNVGDEPNSTVPNSRLVVVDPCTGLATAVDDTLSSQPYMAGLAFHPDGRLFGTDATLYEIDPATGVAVPVGAMGVRIGAADFHPVTGVLYGAELGGTHRLGTIDIDTGAFNVIGTLDGFQGPIGSIAFTPSGDKLYGTHHYYVGEIFEIDPVTAAVSNIDTISGQTPQGMGFGPPCGEQGGDCGVEPPEPETIVMTLVIKPGGCPNPLNPKSKGVTPMALIGTEDVDVADIDVSSIEINGVSPIRSNHEDVGGPAGRPKDECECHETDADGMMDLTLKFSTQALVATLGELHRDDVVTLRLTGMLMDGTAFEAMECMVVVGK